MCFRDNVTIFFKDKHKHSIVKFVSVVNATHLAGFSFKKARQMAEQFASTQRMFRLTRFI